MPKSEEYESWATHINAERSKALIRYAKALKDTGTIEKSTRYAVLKHILNNIADGFIHIEKLNKGSKVSK